MAASGAGEDSADHGLTGHEDWNQKQRKETPLQRLDRNFSELLQELRVAQVGVQILFAFLLTIAFQPRFESLSEGQKTLYALTIFAGACAMAFLVGPVALHRIGYAKEMKPTLMRVSHFFTLAGLFMMFVSVVCAVSLVAWMTLPAGAAIALAIGVGVVMAVCWVVVPLVLVMRHGSDGQDSEGDGW